MKLLNAARYFDKVPVYDGYSGDFLFRAQFSSFDGRQADGTINKRRQMSLAPDIEVPSHQVIQFDDSRWILGDVNFDSFYDGPLRKTYVTKKVTDTVSLLTPGEASLGETGAAVYAQKLFLNQLEDRQVNSEYDSQYNIFVAKTQSVAKDSFIKVGDKYYHTRNVYFPLEGYTCAASDELSDDCFQTLVFAGEQTYVPATDSYTGTPITTTGLLFDYYQDYSKNTEADPKGVSGDKTIVVAKSAVTPGHGQTLSGNGKNWRIKAVYDYQDAWRLQVALK